MLSVPRMEHIPDHLCTVHHWVHEQHACLHVRPPKFSVWCLALKLGHTTHHLHKLDILAHVS